MTARLPRRTVRLRLTALYGGLFLLSGAGLLAITYVLVSGQGPDFHVTRGRVASVGVVAPLPGPSASGRAGPTGPAVAGPGVTATVIADRLD